MERNVESEEELAMFKAGLAYLDKQKERKMPDSTELIEMWEQEKAMLKEKDFRGDPWRLAYNAFMDGFARGCKVKQKEQKPAEWSEEDEKKREFLIKGLEDRMGFGWASDPFSREDLISWLENLRPQPRQEWSEEDKRMINNIVDDLCYLISWIKTFAGTIDIDATIEDIRGHIKWLRSLRSRPKSSDNWKPSEDEDSKNSKRYENY